MLYVAGIDEIASETQRSEGWTYLTIADSSIVDFNRDSAAILSATKMSAFHGKDFKRKFIDEYEAFLRLVRKHLEMSPHSFLATTLFNESWKSEFTGFVDRLLANSMTSSGIIDNTLIEASRMLAKPLFSFQHLAGAFLESDSVRFEIDEHAVTSGLPGFQPTRAGTAFSPLLPIEIAYRVFRDHCFPRAPELVKNTTKILPDEQSFVVQAADVVGNLSVAFARWKLGSRSNTLLEKVKLFERVFGDTLASFDFDANLELSGSDLVLKHDGAWTFRIASGPSVSP